LFAQYAHILHYTIVVKRGDGLLHPSMRWKRFNFPDRVVVRLL
jgi:hypothetical protein